MTCKSSSRFSFHLCSSFMDCSTRFFVPLKMRTIKFTCLQSSIHKDEDTENPSQWNLYFWVSSKCLVCFMLYIRRFLPKARVVPGQNRGHWLLSMNLHNTCRGMIKHHTNRPKTRFKTANEAAIMVLLGLNCLDIHPKSQACFEPHCERRNSPSIKSELANWLLWWIWKTSNKISKFPYRYTICS